jgi:hypothetical protein
MMVKQKKLRKKQRKKKRKMHHLSQVRQDTVHEKKKRIKGFCKKLKEKVD